MNTKFNFVALSVVTVLVIVAMSIFTVDQRQYALVFQLGEVKRVITEPGLNFKIPMIQNVRYFDRRILTLDNNEPERFITSEKKNVLVEFGYGTVGCHVGFLKQCNASGSQVSHSHRFSTVEIGKAESTSGEAYCLLIP